MLRSSILCLLLVLLPLTGWTAEIDPSSGDILPVQAAGAPWWAGLVTFIVTTVLTPFLVQLLRAKAAAASAVAQNAAVDTNGKLIDQRAAVVERVKAYLWGTAAAIAEKRFPRLAEAVVAGRLKTPEDVKTELRLWGDDLREQAVFYFKGQGIDLAATIGLDALDALIERAANAVSPFPGKDTAVALLKDEVAPLLADKGIAWMREHTMGRMLEPMQLVPATVEAKG
jgi:hypothetical protein